MRLVLLILVSVVTLDAHAQAPTKAEQAKALLSSGVKHFNVGEYQQALSDFKASYELVPSPIAAAHTAQAQANVDAEHASLVVDWISRGVGEAQTQFDSDTLKAFARACAAALQLASHMESGYATLKSKNADLQQRIAKLEAENEKLRKSQFTFTAVIKNLENRLTAKDFQQWQKDKCLVGACQE